MDHCNQTWDLFFFGTNEENSKIDIYRPRPQFYKSPTENVIYLESYLEETIIDPLTPPIQDNATQIGINHPSHSGNVRLATSIATASELKNLFNSNGFEFCANQLLKDLSPQELVRIEDSKIGEIC